MSLRKVSSQLSGALAWARRGTQRRRDFGGPGKRGSGRRRGRVVCMAACVAVSRAAATAAIVATVVAVAARLRGFAVAIAVGGFGFGARRFRIRAQPLEIGAEQARHRAEQAALARGERAFHGGVERGQLGQRRRLRGQSRPQARAQVADLALHLLLQAEAALTIEREIGVRLRRFGRPRQLGRRERAAAPELARGREQRVVGDRLRQ